MESNLRSPEILDFQDDQTRGPLLEKEPMTAPVI
jgi:hypothetical protein